MNPPDILAALIPVADVLEQLQIPYYVGGSVASTARGLSRATVDIDLVAALRPEHVQPLVERLHADYYIDAEAIQEAIKYRSSTGLIHLPTMIKVDVFLPRGRAHEQEILNRLQRETLDESVPSRTFPLPSAEDVVLAKLEWYERGNRVSDRQWYDILGVLKTQGPAIDAAYLRRWAANLGLSELLERALLDAGMT